MPDPVRSSPRRRLGPLLALALLASAHASAAAEPRQLSIDAADTVEVEVATVAVASGSGSPVVVLREPGTPRFVPIFIGPVEAQAILRALRGLEPVRPLTHDLLGGVIAGLGARLERVFVDDLADNTFLGILELRASGREQPVLVDTRPSDAIALALRTGASIHVARKVMAAAQRIAVEGLAQDQVATALGITVVPASAELREALELPADPGVVVSGVRGAAGDAGMRPGALLLDVNGAAPDSPMAFLEQVRDTPPGEPARLGFWQDGARHEIELPADLRAPPARDIPRGPRITL